MPRNNGHGLLKAKISLLLKKSYAWSMTTHCDLPSGNIWSDHSVRLLSVEPPFSSIGRIGMPWCTAASLHLPVAASIQLVPSYSCTKSVATRVLHKSLVLKRCEGRRCQQNATRQSQMAMDQFLLWALVGQVDGAATGKRKLLGTN